MSRYVTADYERGSFSVSQCSWVSNSHQNIVAILPLSEVSPSNGTSETLGSTSSPSGVPVGAVAGGVVGGLAVLAAIGLLLWYFCIKPRHRRAEAEAAVAAAKASESENSASTQPSREDPAFHKTELDNSEAQLAAEMEDPVKSQWVVETDGNILRPKNEMEGNSTPNIHEMDGKRYIYPAEADGREVEIYEMPAREEVAAEMMGQRDSIVPAPAPGARWSWATTPGGDITSPGLSRGDVVSPFTPIMPGREVSTGFSFGDVTSSRSRGSERTSPGPSAPSEREDFPSPPISEQSPRSRRAHMASMSQ
jgi:hypothetical protein